ncbi:MULTISPECIES: hypothetical protein [Mycolicibacter]|uniref:Uncharacterized protein n=2 Tax=Mycolicibacter TaxID=1073531 RepID=A0ABU5XMI2_9MYCO|nr:MULTISPECIES: hypothetical protein [unclassified Mycolicibacter]MEB3023416.1 hypothetical protein [Mycolicibacter sp. MYC098]MEB3033758.1 hypothetical protein [Mycolicibacter sp. MYC340]
MDEDERIRELSIQARLDYRGISEEELRISEPGWFETGSILPPSELGEAAVTFGDGH